MCNQLNDRDSELLQITVDVQDANDVSELPTLDDHGIVVRFSGGDYSQPTATQGARLTSAQFTQDGRSVHSGHFCQCDEGDTDPVFVQVVGDGELHGFACRSCRSMTQIG